jgi:hypothetical protein
MADEAEPPTATPVADEAPVNEDIAADAGAAEVPVNADLPPLDDAAPSKEGEAEAEGAEDAGEGAEGDGAEAEEGAGEGDPNEDDEAPSGIGARIEADPFELEFLVKLPNIISFTDIPSVNECRSVWRLGMRKIEECFAEHIANLHMDFEDKAKEFENIQN